MPPPQTRAEKRPSTSQLPLEGAAVKTNTKATLHAALAYAARGWYVLPIKIVGKKKLPLIAGKKTGGARWGATTDPETIKRYWRRWPTAGIGIATGESGLVV